MHHVNKYEDYARQARILILDVANRVGGCHIGGCFSIIDFFVTYYTRLIELTGVDKNDIYSGDSISAPKIIMSKGHCYLAQLASLDIVCGERFYTSSYLKKGNNFFGHPKRDPNNYNFPVSTGALGQGVTFGNGLAFAYKFKGSKSKVISIIGDGELNEGSTTESFLFSSHHKLNHHFILDNNNQMSLGKTSEIFNIGRVFDRLKSYGLDASEINGHDFNELLKSIDKLILNDSCYSSFLILNTIKGKGVSFMEGDPKWHHRRFKNDEFEMAINELKKQK